MVLKKIFSNCYFHRAAIIPQKQPFTLVLQKNVLKIVGKLPRNHPRQSIIIFKIPAENLYHYKNYNSL